MAAKIQQYFRLLGLYARMDAQWLTQDTVFCILTVCSETLLNLSSVLGVFLLALRFGGIGNMTADEILFMLGYFNLVNGIINLRFTNYNVANISRRIGRGQLDHMLLMPVSFPMQLMTEGFIPVSGSGILLGGVIITVIAVIRLRLTVTLSWLALLLGLLVCSVLLLLAISYIAAAAAFYHPAGSEEISTAAMDGLTTLAPYPLGALSAWAQGFFCTVFPAGCLAWLPTSLLLGKEIAFPGGLLFPVLTALFCGAAGLLFRKGRFDYAKIGNMRYRAIGHRR